MVTIRQTMRIRPWMVGISESWGFGLRRRSQGMGDLLVSPILTSRRGASSRVGMLSARRKSRRLPRRWESPP